MLDEHATQRVRDSTYMSILIKATKRVYTKTAHRQNGLSPKRPIAKTAHSWANHAAED